MTEFSDSIAIVFPADWPRPTPENPEPHCTLLYLGKISEASYTKEDVQSVLNSLNIQAPGTFATKDLELFGKDKNILVLTLDADKLSDIREALENELESIGARNGSEFTEYKPHVTVGVDITEPEGEIPSSISLFEPILWWGEER